MGMSPSRMPQTQGMIAGHGGSNMVGQTANQGQFLPQTQFPPGSASVTATGAMNVTVGPGMGQPQAQAAVTQVRHDGDEGYGAVVNSWRNDCFVVGNTVHFRDATKLC